MSEAAPAVVVSDEAPATTPGSVALRWLVNAIAVAMSLYHMYVAAFGPPEAIIFRGTHLLFALTLVFLLYPLKPRGAPAWRSVDLMLLALGYGFVLHIFTNYDYFINRIIYIDELTTADKFYAVVAVAIVLEATRRVIGLALPLTALAFLVYAIGFTRITPQVLMEQLYFSTEGIFGSTLGVSASYVMLFVLFGSFMERSGTGQLFMDFSMSLTGHTAGGPGKVAIVSSALFGTVSGSAVANVMVDGADHHTVDEAHRIPSAVRRGGRGRRVDRRPDHAAGHGRRRVRDGRIPRRSVRAGCAVGGHSRRCCTTCRCSSPCISTPSATAWPASRSRNCRAFSR